MSSISTHSLASKSILMVWQGPAKWSERQRQEFTASLERSIPIMKIEEVHLKQPMVLLQVTTRWRRHSDTMDL